MDAIADTTISQANSGVSTAATAAEEVPSLLTVIIETNPYYWALLDADNNEIKHVIESIIVLLNSHLATNSSNKVAILAAHYGQAKFLYPYDGSHSSNESQIPFLKNKNIYRQFKVIDELIINKLNDLFNEPISNSHIKKSTVQGALSLALTYINQIKSSSGISLNSRILVVSTSTDISMSYIPVMNSIFTAQTMRIPIDICKLGTVDSVFLQQAADETNGVYLLIQQPKGLIQYLTTVFSIDPSIRNLVALPTIGDIDFRASCFLTGNIVDIGYVCSVCLCVLSQVLDLCPVCSSKFDPIVIDQLKRKPAVKKKKIADK